MKTLLIIWTIFAAFPGVAQLRKIETFYKKGDYTRCLNYCQQAKPGQNKEEYRKIKVYQCWSYWSLYRKNPVKISYLDQALQVHRTEKFTSNSPTAEISTALLNTLRNVSDSLHRTGNKNLTKKYVKIQASQFKDTSYLYTTYFPVITKAIPVAKKEAREKESLVRISRTDLLRYSEQFLSIPYKWAGEDSSGFDCSGLVAKVFRRFGYPMAHGAKDQAELGESISRHQLKPGDLVFFGKRYDTGRCKIDHVAIVHGVTDTKLIVIHSTSKGVNIQELNANDYWGKKILFYKNLIDHYTIPTTNRL